MTSKQKKTATKLAYLEEELRETESLACSRDTNDPTAAAARCEELRQAIEYLKAAAKT